MKKYRKIFIIIPLFLLVSLSLIFINSNKNFEAEEIKNIVKINKGISMNLEQTAGAGDYKTVTQSRWPTEGYIFNSELSRCENGSELSWDDTKKVVIVSGNLSDKCYVYFDKYLSPVVNSFTYTATKTSLTITASVTKGTADISKYYFSIDSGSTYKESNTNSFTFTELSVGTTYTIMIKTKDSLNKESEVYSNIAKTNDFSIADYCTSGTTLSTCVKNFGNQGSSISNIYIHNSSLANGAGDNSYRFAGANPNNYVCFGSTASPCPADNLYRIVGVFGDNNHGVSGKQLVKLIKYDYADNISLGGNGDYYVSGIPPASDYKGSLKKVYEYYWNYNASHSASNTWSTSLLNKTNLNINFIFDMGTEWASKIATTTWKVGGNTEANISQSIPSVVYKNEITSPAENTTYSAKIGLMYVSDYGFAASPSAWTTLLYNYTDSVNGSTIRSQNWMHMGYSEWTISRYSDNTASAFCVYSDSHVTNSGVRNSKAIRPVFNLEQSVTYVSGTGTQSDPIIIN